MKFSVKTENIKICLYHLSAFVATFAAVILKIK
jgi:ribose/xylose/arabinose/galactoside ABC-type transport system permease subunit